MDDPLIKQNYSDILITFIMLLEFKKKTSLFETIPLRTLRFPNLQSNCI